jgi:hypothetical protein
MPLKHGSLGGIPDPNYNNSGQTLSPGSQSTPPCHYSVDLPGTCFIAWPVVVFVAVPSMCPPMPELFSMHPHTHSTQCLEHRGLDTRL